MEMFVANLDPRFTVNFSYEESRYLVMFEREKIKYGHWLYSECIHWLWQHGYIDEDTYVDEKGCVK